MNVTHDMSVLSLITNASVLVQLVMAGLLICSIFSWYYIFIKGFTFKRASSQSDKFERDFWSGGDLKELFQRAVNSRDGSGTMERLFERLYRMARELEAKPQRSPALVARLLRELFEPLEVVQLRDPTLGSRIVCNGAGLIVPVPLLGEMQPADAGTRSLLVRHARKGQRLFTSEDARLTDRIVEQLHRAVAFDRAVEQGRSEERTRIAQDLHDDIGARLLTLMYQAPNPDIEDYIRHTLQDLKTLTRGLAAQNHRLSDAAGEWKVDLSQRLALAHCDLLWQLDYDQDIELTMVQWSAMTRILRELVSNAIAHARASRVVVSIALLNDQLDLSVADNGHGSAPEAWPHGLGLGGVRKRVKQLSGSVEWLTNEPRGIVCRVHVPLLSRYTEVPH